MPRGSNSFALFFYPSGCRNTRQPLNWVGEVWALGRSSRAQTSPEKLGTSREQNPPNNSQNQILRHKKRLKESTLC